jgi:hypothetical protein
MWKKLLIVAVVLAVALAALGIAVSADDRNGHRGKSRSVNWKIAGSIFNDIQAVPSPGASPASFTLLNLSAKGSPGKARIEVVGTSQLVPLSDLCPDGTGLQFEFEGGFVATFSDLSMLFFVIDDALDAKNALCIDFQGPATGVFDYLVTGGTGRFEGATGRVTVRNTAWGVSPALSAEIGEIVGTIELP